MFFKRNGSKDYKKRLEAAKKAADHHVKYVTERIGDTDEVIGRDGAIALRDGELIVFASQDILFRCDIAEVDLSELLSKDGVIVKGPDKERGGEARTIIVYYVYYR